MCDPNCPSSPKSIKATKTTTKTNVVSVAKSPLPVDDSTLNAMMTNLETFGHGLGQFTVQQPIPGVYQSTPFAGSSAAAARQELSFSQDISGLDEASFMSSGFLLRDSTDEMEAKDESISAKKQESIIEWFDRSVELELEKRKDDIDLKEKRICKKKATAQSAHTLSVPKQHMMKDLARADASGIEIIGGLMHEKDADLIEAVEKFATAEAMCNFAGAVEAAEEAARSVPIECVEEAAAAGARGYQKEITSIVQESIPRGLGENPIEVVGYVGVTRPKNPRRP